MTVVVDLVTCPGCADDAGDAGPVRADEHVASGSAKAAATRTIITPDPRLRSRLGSLSRIAMSPFLGCERYDPGRA
jgi:hypothetical protein